MYLNRKQFVWNISLFYNKINAVLETSFKTIEKSYQHQTVSVYQCIIFDFWMFFNHITLSNIRNPLVFLSSPQLYDATVLAESYSGPELDILIDQGRDDQFLSSSQLLPDNLIAACSKKKIPVVFRLQQVSTEQPIMKRNCMQGNQVNYIWPWCLVLSHRPKNVFVFILLELFVLNI